MKLERTGTAGSMPARDSDALVLRTYPYKEGDLIVSFFTRDRGKLRGVAYGARRPKSKFGSSLQRLAESHLYFTGKENAELVRLQRAELHGPTSLWKADYSTSVVLDLIAETSDRLLPEREPNDACYRLLRLVVGEICSDIVRGGTGSPISWRTHRALVYFLLWSARLGGWLPPFDRCCESERMFQPGERVYFSADRDGLFQARSKTPGAWPLEPPARVLAASMLQLRVDKIPKDQWRPSFGLSLQRYLLQRTEAELESRLRGARALRSLWQGD